MPRQKRVHGCSKSAGDCGSSGKPEYNAAKELLSASIAPSGATLLSSTDLPDGEKKSSSLKVREANLRLLRRTSALHQSLRLTPTLAGSETRRALVEELHTLLSGVSERLEGFAERDSTRVCPGQAAEVLTQIEHSMRGNWHIDAKNGTMSRITKIFELPSAVCRNDINYRNKSHNDQVDQAKADCDVGCCFDGNEGGSLRYWVTRWR